MEARTHLFRITIIVLWAALLSGCGWVDSGVGGNAPPVTDKADDVYSVSVGAGLTVDAQHGVLANDSDGGNTPLTARLVTGPEHAASFNLNSDGSFDYLHNGDGAPSDGFVYVANDGIDDSPPTQVRIDILQPPVAADSSLETLQDQPASGTVTASDPNGDALTFSAPAASDSGGSIAMQSDGKYTYTPPAGYSGPDSFTFSVDDGHQGTDTGTVTITVVKPNSPPKAGSLTISTEQDKPKSGKLSASDADGDKLTFSLASGPAHGSATVKSNGDFTYAPAAGYTGPDSFTFSVSDGQASASAKVSITVTPPANNPPTANNLNISTQQDTPTSGKLTATDADGDPLSFALASGPAHGSANVKPNGDFTYAPAAGYTGPDGFTFSVSDGKASDSATVSISVTAPANNPPTAVSQSISTDQDTAVSGKLTASDPDGDKLTFALASGPAHGSANVKSNGDFTYAPASGYHGSDSFSFSVSDGKGGTDTGTVSITVAATNTAPTANSQSISTDQDTSTSGKLTASDPDGDPLTFALASAPAHGSANVKSNGDFTYAPAAGYTGADSFSFSVSDGKGGTDTGTVSVTVNATNTAPTADDQNITTDQDTSTSGKLTASDPDGDPLTFSLASGPTNGSATVQANGDFSYTPASGYSGKDAFTFGVDDGNGGTDTGNVSITVNSTVSTTADSYTVTATDYSVAASTGVLANDGTGSTGTSSGVQLVGGMYTAASAQRRPNLQASLVTPPKHGTLKLASDGSFEYRHDGSDTRQDSFTYRASDGSHRSAITSVTLGLDLPPVAQHGCWVTSRERPLREQLHALVSGRPLFSIIKQPDHGSVALLDNTSGEFRYEPGPAADAATEDMFAFGVIDHAGRSDDGVVDIIYAPRIMVLGADLAAGLTQEASQLPAQPRRGGFRAPLQQVLERDGYSAEFVGGEQSGGGLDGVDPDHEGHPGWSDTELAWGREGYPVDGVRAWLDRSRPDIVLLTAGDGAPDPAAAGIQSLLDEIALWSQTPGNHPVHVFVGTRLEHNPPDPAAPAAAFNDSLATIVTAAGDANVQLVRLDAALLGADGRPEASLYGDAGLPNAAGYERLAKTWFDALRDTLDEDYRCPGDAP